MSATADGGAAGDVAAWLRDPATTDQAVADRAGTADATGAALIAADEGRLLRAPAIVARLFANPQAPMAAVNRAIAACAKAGVKVDGIPGFDDVAAAVAAEPA